MAATYISHSVPTFHLNPLKLLNSLSHSSTECCTKEKVPVGLYLA